MSDAKDWTIMVYLAGDNDLSETMARRVLDMRRIRDRVTNINLLVYYDGNNPTIKTRYENMTGGMPTATSLSTRIPVEPVKLVVEQNSSSPWTVKRFVKWCIEDQGAKADNYALIIAGHGDGFQRNSFMEDKTSMGYLTVKGLKQSLKEIREQIISDQQFQILAFDSCVMNTFEIAYELQIHVETLVGSQGNMQESGWSYTDIVEGLVRLDSSKPIPKYEITKLFVDSAINPNDEYFDLNARSLDMSVFNLEPKALKTIFDNLHLLGASLSRAIPKEAKSSDQLALKESVMKAILSAHWRCQTYLYEQSIDIIDFCQNLSGECFQIQDNLNRLIRFAGRKEEPVAEGEAAKVTYSADVGPDDVLRIERAVTDVSLIDDISEKCHAVIESVDACVQTSCFSGSDYQFSNGMSLFFPWTLYTLHISKRIYEVFSFACDQHERKHSPLPWYSFLYCYLNESVRRQEPELRFSPFDSHTKGWLTYDKTLLDPPDQGMLDPPDQGMLSGDYKKYFSRMKNFDWTTKSGCSKEK